MSGKSRCLSPFHTRCVRYLYVNFDTPPCRTLDSHLEHLVPLHRETRRNWSGSYGLVCLSSRSPLKLELKQFCPLPPVSFAAPAKFLVEVAEVLSLEDCLACSGLPPGLHKARSDTHSLPDNPETRQNDAIVEDYAEDEGQCDATEEKHLVDLRHTVKLLVRSGALTTQRYTLIEEGDLNTEALSAAATDKYSLRIRHWNCACCTPHFDIMLQMKEESALGVLRLRIRRIVSGKDVRARLLRASLCLVRYNVRYTGRLDVS